MAKYCQKPLSLKAILVVAMNEHVHIRPYSLILLNHKAFDEVNKGIREKENGDCFATKGTFKNKVLFTF